MRTFLRMIVWTATFLLAGVTAAANYKAGLLIGAGQERYIYAVGGTVLDVGKTFLPTLMATFLVGPLTPGLFFRHIVGWTVWALAVTWSVACALSLYAIVKDARVGDTVGHQALHQQLIKGRDSRQAALAALAGVRTAEQVDGEIAVLKRDRLWNRTKECSDATAPESRDYCGRIDKLRAELPTVRPAAAVLGDRERLERELREIETKLAGIDLTEVMRKADPATEALGRLLGWDGETVKTRLAFLIAILFECAGLLPWIIAGSHAAGRGERQEPLLPKAEKADPPEPIKLPEIDSLASSWAQQALVRRRGSFVPAGEMSEQFETWCRANGHDLITKTAFGKQMTALGFERRKHGGQQRYVDVALIPKSRELRLIDGGAP
jgi:hypothetical protein